MGEALAEYSKRNLCTGRGEVGLVSDVISIGVGGWGGGECGWFQFSIKLAPAHHVKWHELEELLPSTYFSHT